MARGVVEIYKTEDPLPCTVAPGGTVTAGQIVRLTGAGSYMIATAGAAADDVLGMAQQDANGDDPDRNRVGVIISGVVPATASGAVDEGDLVCSAAGGAVRTWVAGTDPVAAIVGRAMTAAINAAEVEVLLKTA